MSKVEMPNINAMLIERLDRMEEKLDQLREESNFQRHTADPEEYLTADQTAKLLDCSKKHIYSLKDKVPHVLRGSRLYFKRADLITYMESGRKNPRKKSRFQKIN